MNVNVQSEEIASERHVLRMALIIGVTSLLILSSEILGRLSAHSEIANWLSWGRIAAGFVVLGALAAGAPVALRQLGQRRVLGEKALAARQQVEQLFQMTGMLQSAIGHEDANGVLRATASSLLSGFGGALYVFNNSRDRLDLSTSWDWPGETPPPETVSPAQCWALKRGKPHVSLVGTAALRCEHLPAAVVALEIPMLARGEVYGLLSVQAAGDHAEERLAAISPLASAIADAMSLTLSNITLREKLRTQALRDALTGLYNRRYLEDVLARCANLSERRGHPLSVLMIDLDHFKRLNDEHGHALGDAVLRDVAAAIVGTIRPCDVACRYGGEEILIVLPDASLTDAVLKGDVLRARIENLSDNYGFRITASFGVATLPESTPRAADLVTDADAALYRAKQEGRNRVVTAPRRSEAVMSILSAAAE